MHNFNEFEAHSMWVCQHFDTDVYFSFKPSGSIYELNHLVLPPGKVSDASLN